MVTTCQFCAAIRYYGTSLVLGEGFYLKGIILEFIECRTFLMGIGKACR